MAKTKQELEEIKSRVAELSEVLQDLSEDELSMVLGGMDVKASMLGIYDESCAVISMSGDAEESCAEISASNSWMKPTGGLLG